jgi:hypothetical protein
LVAQGVIPGGTGIKVRGAYNKQQRPNARLTDKREREDAGYCDSPAKLEKELAAALELTRLRLAAQREELVRQRRLREGRFT